MSRRELLALAASKPHDGRSMRESGRPIDCFCGDEHREDGRVKCIVCGWYSHKSCVAGLGIDESSFTCFKCQDVERYPFTDIRIAKRKADENPGLGSPKRVKPSNSPPGEASTSADAAADAQDPPRAPRTVPFPEKVCRVYTKPVAYAYASSSPPSSRSAMAKSNSAS